MATTRIIYNGVVMENVLTRTFDQEARYDDSGTDLLHHDFTIAGVGVVHGISPTLSPPTFVSPTGAGDMHPVELERMLQRLLLEPRKHFQYYIGDYILVQAAPMAANRSGKLDGFDVNNGPKPQHVNIIHIAGEKSFRVEFEIKLSLVMCTDNSNYSGVLSNRWGIEETIDAAHYTRRTVRGRLRVASSTLNPHAFRGWVVPGLPKGFKRDEIHVVSTPDGLNLDYLIVDRQIVAAPPWPATDWKATHTIVTNDGLSIVSQVDVWLQGPPEVDRKALIATAVRVMDAKLNVLDKPDNAGFQILDAALIDHMESNTVEARMAIKHTPENFTDFFGLAGKALGESLEGKKFFQNYNRLVARPPSSYPANGGTWQLLCYLQSPCDARHEIPSSRTGEKESKNEPTKQLIDQPYISTSETTTLPDYLSPYSQSHLKAMYTSYEVSSRYSVDRMRVALPVADGGSQRNAASVKVVTLASRGVAKRVIRIVAERVGDWPAIPAPDDYQDSLGGGALMDYHIQPSAPRKTVDGRKSIYRVEADYSYVLPREPNTSEALRTGSLPWDLSKLEQNAFPATALVSPGKSDAIA